MYLYAILSVVSLGTLCLADLKVLLLHTNDMHARFQQADRYLGLCLDDSSPDCYGGFARLKTTVEAQKKIAAAAGRYTIFLNAGDNYQGTPYYTFFKWEIVAKLVDMLGIDVMSLGNHEFDDGVESLSQYIANVSVPNVCSNLNTTLEQRLQEANLTPSYILNVGNVKIGVIGYLTPDTKFLAHVRKVKFLDEIPSIRKEAQRLRAENVKILIALGHSGYVIDQQIAKEVEEIDLVVGGHSHTFLYTGTPPDPEDIPIGDYPTVITQASGKKVPVVQAYYGTKYLGYLELDFDDGGNLKSWNGEPILLSGNLPQDPDVLAALRPYEKELHDKISRVVGYSTVFLSKENSACRLEECNLGNMLADSYVDYATRKYTNSQGWTVASVALQQAGGIRASINHQGPITVGDLITVAPFSATIVVKEISGSLLLLMLEFAVHRYEETFDGHVNEFLQVAGLKVVYNMQAAPGSRVVSVQVRCADCGKPEYLPLDQSAIYKVAMPEYIGNGGDGFRMLANVPDTYVFDVDYMVLSQYIEKHSPVYPAVEGRIIIQNYTDGSSSATTITVSRFLLLSIIIITIILRSN
ncbi:protein 5NUC-like isoform X2 [Macrosteles quadrilineatus]|uniref:protein 5NUC-like isoform X2 n=1 Tax=Macrosteles quadrilineatus TaxID=74068 RepID=UPI0023E2D704|nr:protein 5NUC-like isoform X2 [Macrosteles quadrilineatus]